jgi:hypothetical protein
MTNKLLVPIAVLLFLHGAVHLLGTAVYTGQVTLAGFAYKTTVLGGHWNLGGAGIRLFGVVWLVAALGFGLAGYGLLASTPWAQAALLATTLLSLLITLLDWPIASAGAAVDALILLALRFAPWLWMPTG